jgi:hypothetical protein
VKNNEVAKPTDFVQRRGKRTVMKPTTRSPISRKVAAATAAATAGSALVAMAPGVEHFTALFFAVTAL